MWRDICGWASGFVYMASIPALMIDYHKTASIMLVVGFLLFAVYGIRSRCSDEAINNAIEDQREARELLEWQQSMDREGMNPLIW